MKGIIVFLVVVLVVAVMPIVASCRPAPEVYYHVTVKTTDGAILYDDTKPWLSVSVYTLMRGSVTIKVHPESQARYFFEATGSNLLVTRERVEKE